MLAPARSAPADPSQSTGSSAAEAQCVSAPREFLSEWDRAADQRIGFCQFLIVVISCLFAYYGWQEPQLVRTRQLRVEDAREDVLLMRGKFRELAYLISGIFDTHTEAGSSVGDTTRRFRDVILPELHRAERRSSPEQRASAFVTDVANVVAALAHLSDIRSRRLIDKYHTSPESAPHTTNGETSNDPARARTTLAEDDEPLNELCDLDDVIRSWQHLRGNINDSALATDIREEVVNSTHSSVRVHDTITQTFPFQFALGEYTPQFQALRTHGAAGLKSYQQVAIAAGAPVRLQTLNDLNRLLESLDSTATALAIEQASPDIQVPLIGIRVDRATTLWVVPLVVLFLYHLLAAAVEVSTAIRSLVVRAPLSARMLRIREAGRVVLSRPPTLPAMWRRARSFYRRLTQGHARPGRFRFGPLAATIAEWTHDLLGAAIFWIVALFCPALTICTLICAPRPTTAAVPTTITVTIIVCFVAEAHRLSRVTRRSE